MNLMPGGLSDRTYVPGMSGRSQKSPGEAGEEHGSIYDISKPLGSAASKWNKTRSLRYGFFLLLFLFFFFFFSVARGQFDSTISIGFRVVSTKRPPEKQAERRAPPLAKGWHIPLRGESWRDIRVGNRNADNGIKQRAIPFNGITDKREVLQPETKGFPRAHARDPAS
jgi:hypothetical protein